MIVIVIGIGTEKDRAVKRGRGRKIGIVGHHDRVGIEIHGLERLTNINTCNWYVRREYSFFCSLLSSNAPFLLIRLCLHLLG
jgi:hypothetical protein